MSPAALQVLLIGGAAILVLWAAHALTWRALVWFGAILNRLPALKEHRAWRRFAPFGAGIRVRAPTLHRILAQRFGVDHFTSLPLVLCIFAALYVAVLLGGLTEDVIEADAVLRFDQAVNEALASWRLPWLVGVFVWITALGAGPALTMAALVGTAFLWADRRPVFILPLWLTFLGAQATTWSGKYVIARVRPGFIQAVSEASPSFPSGHATASMALYGFLAYAIARDLPVRRKRFEVVYWTGVLILLIAFSRLFLSVHYTTDVLAGLMVGAFWLLTGFAVTEWRRGAMPIPQPV